MKVVVLSRDLIIASRILAEAESAGHQATRIEEVDQLDAAGPGDLLFVNWAERGPSWADALRRWCAAAPEVPSRVRLILFGPHTDLAAHEAALAAGLGPMVARSTLLRRLPTLLDEEDVRPMAEPAEA